MLLQFLSRFEGKKPGIPERRTAPSFSGEAFLAVRVACVSMQKGEPSAAGFFSSPLRLPVRLLGAAVRGAEAR